MKRSFKRITAGLLAIMISISPMMPMRQVKVKAAETTARQMESLSRGLVAVNTDAGNFLSWRLLGTESYSTKFNVYRDGVKIASNISDSTNYVDAGGSKSSTYYVRSVVGGSEVTQSDTVTPWGNQYKDVPINKPADTTLNGTTVTYSANDATVADVDGDGEYEIILKWDPSNSQDNSISGYTSNVYVDCYEMDGTQKWRIDLGKNIRAGAHYTQIIAYDLNGDGKAEVAMKTADGTVAGDGSVIGDASKDYRNSSGYVLSGPEYLTLFEGKTGKELVTIDYNPQRGTVSSWGDSYGNRVDRFLAGVAYFDGKTPSLVICRGYYTRAVIVSYEYKGGKLNEEWVFDTNSSGNSAYAGQGNHNLSIADVDNDGKDEVVYGSAVIDHDGTGLYATGDGHGDALHVGDFDPDHSGMEIFQVHETKTSDIESIQFRDAKTGSTIWAKKLSKDIGRGLIINIDPDYYPFVTLASSGNYLDADGNSITSSISGLGINFATYWDGDLYREGLDGTSIRKWDYNNDKVVTALSDSNVHSCNSTKATPTLSADIMGDWREEVIWARSDDKALRIYTTTDVTDAKLYTLMHDSQYRCAIAWQNVGYNQPPHTSYYIGPTMATPSQPSIYTVGSYTLGNVGSSNGSTQTQATTQATESNLLVLKGTNVTTANITSPISVDGFGIMATTEKTVTTEECSVAVENTTISRIIRLGGGGSTTYRSIKLETAGASTVTAYVRSSSTTATRTVNLLDSSGSVVASQSGIDGSSAQKVTFTVSSAGEYYIASSGSGLDVYYVSATNAVKTTVTSSGETPTQTPTQAPTEETTQAPVAVSQIHNFTQNGLSSSFYSIAGNLSTGKGSVSYAGLSLTQCLKLESSTTLTFTAPSAGTLTLVSGGSESASGKKIKINGTSHTFDSTQVMTVDVSAGSVSITKGDTLNLFYIVYTTSGSTGGSSGGGETPTEKPTTPKEPTAGDKYTLYVGPSRTYKTINEALDAVKDMSRSSDQRVTIMIDPGNYEEMLVIDQENITLKNSSATPSTELKDKGVNIDSNAVRITWYYGHGYTYYSMGSDYKYSESVFNANKSKGKASVTNPGAGSATYWNATVVVEANGFAAEGIIFENSFNQYISEMAAKDIIVAQDSAKEGSTERAELSAGSTKVQEKEYVERASALALANNVTEADFLNCKFVGRQDTLYGGKNVTAVFEKCSIYGGTDYIFGGMKALFYQCNLVANTSDLTSSSIKNDKFYITAPQQASGRGYLFYECRITSTTPGVDTASSMQSKPGYFGRPWAADTGEAVFYKTTIEATNFSSDGKGTGNSSLIEAEGWLDSLKGESELCGEYGTIDLAGATTDDRVSWAQVFTQPKLADGTAIAIESYVEKGWLSELLAASRLTNAADDEIPSTHTHSYTSKVTKEATCTELGVITYTCSCGVSYTDSIEKTAHTYSSEYTVDVQATTTTEGSKSRHCTTSGCSAKTDVTVIPVIEVEEKLNGLVKVNGVWNYYVDGVVDTSYTGLADYGGAKWYVVNGALSFRNTGLYKIGGSYYYIESGKWNESYTGLGECNGATWYVVDGKISFRANGLYKLNGSYYYIENGKWNENFTGLGECNGATWYVLKGKISFKTTGTVVVNGITYTVSGGKVTEAAGLQKINGTYYYVVNGEIDTTYTGLTEYNGAQWYVVKGVLSFRNTGLYKIAGSYYYIENGKWNESYIGLADANGATWYVIDGKIAFGTSGKVVVNGVVYTVSGGKVVG